MTKVSKITLQSDLITSIENFRIASENYRAAEKIYIELKKESKSIRKKFQQKLADDVAKQKGTEAAKEIKSPIQI